MSQRSVQRDLYRVWIARYSRWKPGHWSDVPPTSEALEPADRRCLSASEAQRIIEGFNRQMLLERSRLWAVAVPVRVRVDGDPCRGQVLKSPSIARRLEREVPASNVERRDAKPHGAKNERRAGYQERIYQGLVQSPQRSR